MGNGIVGEVGVRNNDIFGFVCVVRGELDVERRGDSWDSG